MLRESRVPYTTNSGPKTDRIGNAPQGANRLIVNDSDRSEPNHTVVDRTMLQLRSRLQYVEVLSVDKGTVTLPAGGLC